MKVGGNWESLLAGFHPAPDKDVDSVAQHDHIAIQFTRTQDNLNHHRVDAIPLDGSAIPFTHHPCLLILSRGASVLLHRAGRIFL